MATITLDERAEKARLWVAVARGRHIPGESCYVHGVTARWWMRQGELLCADCHPSGNEHKPASDPLILENAKF